MKAKIFILAALLLCETNLFADIIVKGRARVSQGDDGNTYVRCRWRHGTCMTIGESPTSTPVEVYTEEGTLKFVCNSYSIADNGAVNDEDFETTVTLITK